MKQPTIEELKILCEKQQIKIFQKMKDKKDCLVFSVQI